MADYFTNRLRESENPTRTPQTPRSLHARLPWDDDLPVIDNTEDFETIVGKLIVYIKSTIDAAYSYEQLRTTFAGQSLKSLVVRLSDDCHHHAIVAALLAAKYVFQSIDDEGTGLSESRGLACELVAWQFLTYLSEREIIDYILCEVPDTTTVSQKVSALLSVPHGDRNTAADEHTSLLQPPSRRRPMYQSQYRPCDDEIEAMSPSSRVDATLSAASVEDSHPIDAASETTNHIVLKSLVGMNALEVAGIASAKKFLGQRPVQKVIDDIWSGNVVFWETLSADAVRQPRTYNKRIADPFVRLRVPRYQKAFQIGFFVSFLVLFYTVLVSPVTREITVTEMWLFWWIASFAYDELGEFQDTGILFYRVDFWSLWDIAIIGVSAAFLILRIWGKVRQSDHITGIAFDVLSMVAVFLVPRIFSVMSLNPYFGSLIPVLKEMTKAFLKFLPVILILYLGFLTTFSMLARNHMTFQEVSSVLVEVFFGASLLGFDFALKISPYFGYPLMLIFICLTNLVLITSLVSLVSNSLAEVISHARSEYLFQYSIYVLESSSSRRLTYFMPPLNLIPLLFLRPLRLVLPSDHVRRVRIVVLKATHAGFVAMIWAYEASIRHFTRVSQESISITRGGQSTPGPVSGGLHTGREAYAQRPWQVSTLTRPTPTSAPINSASAIADAEVLKLIEKMSIQLDELTAWVNEQQKG